MWVFDDTEAYETNDELRYAIMDLRMETDYNYVLNTAEVLKEEIHGSEYAGVISEIETAELRAYLQETLEIVTA